MTNNDPKIKALQDRLVTHLAFIDEAIRAAQNDTILDVSKMERDIGAICGVLERLNEQEALAFETVIAEMIGKLDELASELEAFQDRHTPHKGH